MANVLPSTVLLALGADVLQKYGTLIKRTAPPARGGETAYTYTGNGLYLAQDGNANLTTSGVPRLEWVTDPVTAVLQPYLLLEAAATNVVLFNRDLTNAAWTKTTMSAARTQVGIDGVTNSATVLTALAGNATCLQAITLGSAARFQTAWVKRLTGSGTVNMTMDNGVTWTPITLTTAWTRVSIPTQTLANPTVGFRLVTNADAIAVDGVQNEAGTFPTATIYTTTVAVARLDNTFFLPFYVGPQPGLGLWIYLRFLERGTTLSTTDTRVIEIGSAAGADPRIWIAAIGSGGYVGQHSVASVNQLSVATLAGAVGSIMELLLLVRPDGSVQLRSAVNGGTEQAGAQSAARAFASAWSGNVLTLNSLGNGTKIGWNAYSRVLVGVGAGTSVTTIPEARAIPL